MAKKKAKKKRRRKRKRLPTMEGEPDCLTCGLCCLSLQEQEVFADLTPEDLEHLSKAWVEKNVLFSRPFDMLCAAIDGANVPMGAIKTKTLAVVKGPMKGYEVCACIALRGSPMKQVSCSIYERRPEVCRKAVEPGDWTCRKLRRRYSAAVLRKEEVR